MSEFFDLIPHYYSVYVSCGSCIFFDFFWGLKLPMKWKNKCFICFENPDIGLNDMIIDNQER